MQDRPDAHELAGAVAQFLFEQVRPVVPRELRFQVLVAANACAILARELPPSLEAWRDLRTEETRILQDLLGESLRDFVEAEPQSELDQNLGRVVQRAVARAVRAGAFDERWDEAVAVVRDSVRAKLTVAHPGYDDFADDGRG